MIADIKVKLKAIEQDIKLHDTYILINRNNAATLRQSMTEQKNT